ncbi:hypothetical protein QN277_010306 [Acacia crassicarpa]|uniref:TFIIE beta domain-containing protein n=1 Tax=Acacia crassicarpa TaxID=499986 RepID=A0AAE1M6I8_9FABA|nr:hypothetical protein QN277_010306 [Acacia crassicarpa]
MFTDGLKTFRMLAGAREQGGPKWFFPKCPRQPGSSKCGYYIMNYMQSIVSSGRITGFQHMALQEKLDRFKKQQQVCQSTVIGIASTRKSAGPAAASSSSIGRTQASATKFSNDTERLQHINSIRKGHIGAQMNCVIDLLRQTRQALTPEQINEACYVDMRANKDVFESLKKNPKVHFDGERFSYKSKHELKDKGQLLHLKRKFPKGIPVIDMKDAYRIVMEDLQVKDFSSFIFV